MPETTMKRTKTVNFGPYTAELRHLEHPAEQFYPAFLAILETELKTGDFAQDTRPLMPFVASWTAPGDPQDLGAWRDLDSLEEYFPLRRAIFEIVNAKLGDDGQDLKN